MFKYHKNLFFYAGVFLISSIVMILQILQSRLFSVTSWYHLSFLVISMAMFGLTMGALKIYRSSEIEQRKHYSSFARKHSIYFGVFILLSLVIQLYVPIISEDMLKTVINLPLVGIITGLAYYHAGIAITLCLTRSPFPVGKTYGVDLLGAGLGCVIALILMENIDTPSAIILASSLAFISALCFKDSKAKTPNNTQQKITSKKLATLLCFCTFVFGMVNAYSAQKIVYPIWQKHKYTPMSSLEYEEWNSISRITIGKPALGSFAWGRSPLFPKDVKAEIQFLTIDGDAGTPLTKFDGDYSAHSYLEYDVTNIAYSLPNLKNSAVIGVGGGRDVLAAKYFGVENVTALDVNPVQVKLLTKHPKYKEYTNLYNQSGVKILNKEARSWFRQNKEKFDLIQMSLIDTWAATGSGAFALSENGLYTLEAWQIFMNDLKDDGVFTLSRWSSDSFNDTGRVLSLAIATIIEQGGERPIDHIAMIKSDRIVTTIIAKSPLSQLQINALKEEAHKKQYEIILLPSFPAPSGVLGELSKAQTIDDLYIISDTQFYDISPSTDMRPFFFNQARLTKPIEVTKLALASIGESNFVSMGQAKATLNLYLIIIFSIIMVGLIIVVPLLRTVENKGVTFIKAGTLYFMLIGLGFMFIEISLLQALGVFLGHPIYGLSVVLFSLIIAAGIGSLISEKLTLATQPKQIVWALLIFIYSIVLAYNLQPIFYHYAEAEIFIRILVSISMIMPIGALMGFGFPTGLRLTEKFDTRATAWFWGINGATGVLGSSLALAFNIVLGIDKTLIIGGVCYGLLCFTFLFLNKKDA